jgi:hypothetical protein
MDVHEQNIDAHELLTLKVEPLLIQKSKRFKVDCYIKEHKSETINSSQLKIHKLINHFKEL